MYGGEGGVKAVIVHTPWNARKEDTLRFISARNHWLALLESNLYHESLGKERVMWVTLMGREDGKRLSPLRLVSHERFV